MMGRHQEGVLLGRLTVEKLCSVMWVMILGEGNGELVNNAFVEEDFGYKLVSLLQERITSGRGSHQKQPESARRHVLLIMYA